MKNRLTVDQAVFLKMPVVDTDIAVAVCDITDMRAVAGKLAAVYGDVAVVVDGKNSTVSELVSLDKAKTVEISAQKSFEKKRYNVADVLRVIDRLTWEDGGCPWDKVQTHDSIRVNMIEEAYEAVDAID